MLSFGRHNDMIHTTACPIYDKHTSKETHLCPNTYRYKPMQNVMKIPSQLSLDAIAMYSGNSVVRTIMCSHGSLLCPGPQQRMTCSAISTPPHSHFPPTISTILLVQDCMYQCSPIRQSLV